MTSSRTITMPEMDGAQASRVPTKVAIPIVVREHAGLPRRGEPVVVGVPLPRGLADANDTWLLSCAQMRSILPCQVSPLAFWPDGSVRWLSACFLADVDAHATRQLELRRVDDKNGANTRISGPQGHSRPSHLDALRVIESDRTTRISGERHLVVVPRGGRRLVSSIAAGDTDVLGPEGIRMECLDDAGRARPVVVESVSVESARSLRCILAFRGRVVRSGLRITGRLTIFAPAGLLRLEATLQNPSRARHAGGCWDLGDPASEYVSGWRLDVDLSVRGPRQAFWTNRPLAEFREAGGGKLHIAQHSSGGENWNSRNHVNRDNVVPLRYRGYRARMGEALHDGLRASPAMQLVGAGGRIACALTDFWEKFPSAMGWDGERLRVEFWPTEPGVRQELQPGEHCTRTVWLHFGDGSACENSDLSWVHEPLAVHVDAKWMAASGVIPWLPSPAAPARPELQTVLREAIDGPSNFFAKREVIDEYGWRHFGDCWADHEAAYYDGPAPIISHYNNQYDVLYGMLVQYLLTGESRWWRLAEPLARHVMDVDAYHTQRDKSAYSGGLFWHTAHYHDAGTCTHRTYSRAMGGLGGGPANEHAYASGLLLYHYLTGDQRPLETVRQLAEWIIDMDSGSQHVLGVLSDAPTGRSSCTQTTDYHGPGRGAGNAIGVLMDAWQGTGEERFLTFAEGLIRRTIHPSDDVAARELNDFERRWSYTVYLQQLARYLLVTEDIERPGGMREYARASLIHYVEWMADHARFSLDHPEQLEYPTETWAAQELRKGNVMLMAAGHVNAEQAGRFRRRGEEFLDRAWSTLMSFPSRDCTRPLALVLQQGYIETHLRSDGAGDSEVAGGVVAVAPLEFVPQASEIRAAVRSPAIAAKMGLRMLRPHGWLNAWKRSWIAERARRLLSRRR